MRASQIHVIQYNTTQKIAKLNQGVPCYSFVKSTLFIFTMLSKKVDGDLYTYDTIFYFFSKHTLGFDKAYK